MSFIHISNINLEEATGDRNMSKSGEKTARKKKKGKRLSQSWVVLLIICIASSHSLFLNEHSLFYMLLV